ncbi:MAG: SDR family NAD(P)-dependent oxidoreductase [Streptosporangiales bacterium]
MAAAGRTILVTGATDGLGRAVAERLARDGATVLLHGRDRGRLDEVAAGIGSATGGDAPRTYQADLADLAEVRALAGEVRDTTDLLHVLVNNAGVGSGEPDGRERRTSADGYELRFAVNYLAGFLLTLELLPLLIASAPARVVNVASLGQAPIDFDDVMLERGYSGDRAYGQSKLAQIMFGFELADRLDPERVTVNSLHPGTFMPTKMVIRERGASVDELETGIESTTWLAAASELDAVTGRFYDRQREARADAQAYEEAARVRLWQLSVDLTGAPDAFAGSR